MQSGYYAYHGLTSGDTCISWSYQYMNGKSAYHGLTSGNTTGLRDSLRKHCSDLRKLAVERGYSLLVTANCWDCGSLVYLLAKPDGGFVILDGLGPDWPIHPCYQHGKRNHSHRSWQAYDSNYMVPVPKNVKWNNKLIIGKNICGTIVKIDGRKSILCDGKYLYRLLIRGTIGKIGECVEGKITRVGSQWGLEEICLIKPPDDLQLE